MNYAEMIAARKLQVEAVARATWEVAQLEAAMVERYCPVQIGEVVPMNWGYGTATCKARITKRSVQIAGWGFSFRLEGKKLNKDGAESANSAWATINVKFGEMK